MDNIKLDGALLTKVYKRGTSSFISYCLYWFLRQQLSAFTTFYNLFQHYLKKDFCLKFFLFIIFTHTPTLLTTKIS